MSARIYSFETGQEITPPTDLDRRIQAVRQQAEHHERLGRVYRQVLARLAVERSKEVNVIEGDNES